jgi:hypothetical protein
MMTELVSPCLRSRMISFFLCGLLPGMGLPPVEDRCYEIITYQPQLGYGRGTDDHLLDRPLESLDAIRNSATMKGVLGWSTQQEAAISARAK